MQSNSIRNDAVQRYMTLTRHEELERACDLDDVLIAASNSTDDSTGSSQCELGCTDRLSMDIINELPGSKSFKFLANRKFSEHEYKNIVSNRSTLLSS